MNKNLYRTIFNKARGLLVVVSEKAKSHHMISSSNQKIKGDKVLHSKKTGTLKQLVFLTYVALGMISVVETSFADGIVVDQSSNQNQRPTIHELGNGTTQVDIASPTRGGVSHNKFSQFDVAKDGVILNNSASSSNTQLAGNIKGNQYLQSSAKVILNEVNSKNPSQLNGYIEVAGQKAQVVVANAAGITCNGCGFINADRATLTTGKPIIENGVLKGYDVQNGKIEIAGRGYRSSGQNYTDLIARSVSINANLWTDNDLNIVTGKNKVNADLTKIEKNGADSVSGRPEFGLDVSALGGMYAGKIKMVGTELGVGVRNQGKIWTNAGAIQISSEGKISNHNSISSVNDIVIKSENGIENHGNIESKKNITFTSRKETKNVGSIKAKDDISFSAGEWTGNDGQITADKTIYATGENFTNGATGKVYARDMNLKTNLVRNQGNLTATNNIDIKSRTVSNLSTMSAGENIKIQSELLDNSFNPGTIIEAKNITLDGDFFKNYGEVNATDNLIVRQTKVANYNRLASVNKLEVNAKEIYNSYGSNDGSRKGGVISSNDVSVKTDKLENGNIIAANNQLDIISHFVENYKSLTAGEQLNLNTESLNNDWNGEIIANNINIQSIDIKNDGKLHSRNQQKIDAGKLINQGIVTSDNNFIANIDNLENRNNATIQAKNVSLKGDNLINTAKISANDLLSINVKSISNQKTLSSSRTVDINSDTLKNDLDAEILSDNLIVLRGNYITNLGDIKSKKVIKINADKEFYNRGWNVVDSVVTGLVQGEDVNITAAKVSNEGQLTGWNYITIKDDYFINNWNGKINGNNININSNSFDNYGLVKAKDNVNIDATNVYNATSMISDYLFKLNALGTFKNDTNAQIVANWQADFSGTNIDNFGKITTGHAININATKIYNNGLLSSNIHLRLTGDKFTNDYAGTVSTETVTANVGYFNNLGNIRGAIVNP